ncbi:hypothetical protein FNF27_00302 [Cafeteria roenbergensis]|uniref:Uncharacterized protein n=2 Tax=Cafeteria roenbergensis TaxID=33653 RepID=A0A5A8EKG0_CAFRO|nr:hypothetical protein FNF29_01436 [Cafeteria roenbergensis]KAA0163587.1 hypothetical protein FNF31_02749 [Cafeteria roenbergensis]KAA0178453.1 hypothetical protein FNF27_00302 [Cafeteria roenbergensis]|eukprot:KAA0156018.1 hypothetical protein FNF29_01436 [Cafeteria roenbergensis]
MARGRLMAMPLLVANMGGEMIYILEQRLRAQSISPSKASKVLCDVVKAMFDKDFVDKLFAPAELYTESSTREVFSQLAHSSIMRLNKSSMDKLYDLMTMGVKQQVVQCRCPEEILDVTRNHLSVIQSITPDPDAQALLAAFKKRVDAEYGAVGAWEMWQLRLAMLRFFQDRRVKVSIFLQELQQNLDGTFVISVVGPMAPGVSPPGTVAYMEDSGVEGGRRDFPAAAASGASGNITLNAGTCPLGLNMYARDRRSRKDSDADATKPKPWPGPNSSTATGPLLRGVPHALRGKGAAGASKGASAVHGSGGSQPGTPARASAGAAADSSVTPESARAGLALLGTLIGAQASPAADETLDLNLFPDEAEAAGTAGLLDDEEDGSGGVVVLDAAGGARTIAELATSLGFDDDDDGGAAGTASGAGGAGGAGGSGEEDGLLDLFDEAAA